MREVTQVPQFDIDTAPGVNQGNWDHPENLAAGQINMHRLFRTLALEPNQAALPLPYSQTSLDVERLTFPDPLIMGRDISGEQLLNRRIFNDGLLIMHRGNVVHESYRNGLTAEDRHVIHSCTKSLCAMLAAIAMDRGLISAEDSIAQYLPQFAPLAAWEGVTLAHVLNMQAGIEYSEDYTNPESHYWQYARAAGYYPPLAGDTAIGAVAWVNGNLTRRAHPPGTTFAYNSCLTIVLGMVLEVVFQDKLAVLFEDLIYRRVGPESDAFFNTDPLGFPIVEGQLNLRLRDFARCASLMVMGGKNLEGEQVIPADFIQQTVAPDPQTQQAYQQLEADPVFENGQYKNKFWVLDPQCHQLTMLGIHGQFAWYDLEQELMIVGVGSYPQQDGTLMMRSLNTLWQGVKKALYQTA